jgi:uncharacterized glyoxalase superfamily protein PhnB
MRLNAIGITCSDVAASLAFYGMLDVGFPDYDPETGHYEADLAGGVRLMLDSEAVMASFIDDYTPPAGNDRVGFAVECDSAADVDATFAAITSAGHPAVREPFDAFWGQRYATVADPDGNHVDLYASL